MKIVMKFKSSDMLLKIFCRKISQKLLSSQIDVIKSKEALKSLRDISYEENSKTLLLI